MGWITDSICQFVTDIIGSVISYFGELINNIFTNMVILNNKNVYVVGAHKFIVALSYALAALFVVRQVFSGYITETDYDSDADPFNLCIRIAETVAMISCSGWIFNTFLKLSNQFASDIIGSTSGNLGVVGKTQELLKIKPDQLGGMMIAFVLLLLLLVICFIAFTIVAAIRGAELIAMKIFFPLFALDLLGTRRERWTNYFTGYMIAFFSYGVQMLFYTIAMKSFVSSKWDNPQYMIGSIAFLYFAIKAPKFLEKYLYSSGVSSAASGGLRLVAQTMVFKVAR